ncbi:Uncharacterised protein [Mycolicibacterium vanbaalenii]|uniref:Uncharacterized protein n=1 Tax=Mycolicibacterium vanbaalenii TaxID=110539 RepID=A0A5S9QYB9_MYCVN|nr:Uncharacterised protein [Mycolicibacterium vanbaalenii]
MECQIFITTETSACSADCDATLPYLFGARRFCLIEGAYVNEGAGARSTIDKGAERRVNSLAATCWGLSAMLSRGAFHI